MTVILTFRDASDGRAPCTAPARHWTVADCEAPEKMVFRQRWSIATRQLVAVAQKL